MEKKLTVFPVVTHLLSNHYEIITFFENTLLLIYLKTLSLKYETYF